MCAFVTSTCLLILLYWCAPKYALNLLKTVCKSYLFSPGISSCASTSFSSSAGIAGMAAAQVKELYISVLCWPIHFNSCLTFSLPSTPYRPFASKCISNSLLYSCHSLPHALKSAGSKLHNVSSLVISSIFAHFLLKILSFSLTNLYSAGEFSS